MGATLCAGGEGGREIRDEAASWEYFIVTIRKLEAPADTQIVVVASSGSTDDGMNLRHKDNLGRQGPTQTMWTPLPDGVHT